MADTPVEIYPAFLDRVEDVLLADETGAFGLRRSCRLAVGRCDDADSEVGFHGVREPQPVPDYGAVLERAESEVHFVFACCGTAAYFGCAEVAVGREESVSFVLNVDCLKSPSNCFFFFSKIPRPTT